MAGEIVFSLCVSGFVYAMARAIFTPQVRVHPH